MWRESERISVFWLSGTKLLWTSSCGCAQIRVTAMMGTAHRREHRWISEENGEWEWRADRSSNGEEMRKSRTLICSFGPGRAHSLFGWYCGMEHHVVSFWSLKPIQLFSQSACQVISTGLQPGNKAKAVSMRKRGKGLDSSKCFPLQHWTSETDEAG